MAMNTAGAGRAPAPVNKHQARTAITLREVLDVAERIFVRDGYDRAQVESIAAGAGRTRGAIYAHFRSKEELFLALLERRIRTKIVEWEELLRGARTQKRRREISREKFCSSMLNPEWVLLLLEFKLYALRNPESQSRLRSLMAMLAEEQNRLLWGNGSGARERTSRSSLAALRAIPSALVLESNFDPSLAATPQSREVLGAIFDALIPKR